MKTQMNLHLGCGDNYIPGFVHIDIIPRDHIDYVCSVDSLYMFKDDSIDLIYASHLLEHFKRNEVPRVLFEWNRVLKRDGILRIAVPDFDKIVHVYQKNKNIEELTGLLFGGQTYDYNFHHVAFNYNHLTNLLEHASFYDIKRYDWRKTIHKDYDDFSQAYLPHLDKESGVLMSLNMECKAL